MRPSTEWAHRVRAALVGAQRAFLVVPAVLWLVVCRQLQPAWNGDTQYSYGWLVPFLSAFLFWRRWQTRPSRAPCPLGIGSGVVAGCLALNWLGVRLVQEVNGDWRLVSWWMVLLAVAFTLQVIFQAGGWAWVGHFAVPVAFMLVAVPLPTFLEDPLTLGLRRLVTLLVVDGLNWVGVPALQQGNLIVLASGRVGIAEACSGVQSLQATLMVTLLLGEWHRFGAGKRLALVIAGFGTALLMNLARTLALVLLSQASATANLAARWHGTASLLEIVLIFLVIGWLAAHWARPRAAAPGGSVGTVVPGPEAGTVVTRWGWALGGAAWLVAVEMAVRAWYPPPDPTPPAPAEWRVAWPKEGLEFRFSQFDPGVAKMLGYDRGQEGIFLRRQTQRWVMDLLQWDTLDAPGSAGHSPEVCGPATGWPVKAGPNPLRVRAGVWEVPLLAYVLTNRNEVAYIFTHRWIDGAQPRTDQWQDPTWQRRLAAVWQRNPQFLSNWEYYRLRAALRYNAQATRNHRPTLGKHLLLITGEGFPDARHAQDDLADLLASILRPK